MRALTRTTERDGGTLETIQGSAFESLANISASQSFSGSKIVVLTCAVEAACSCWEILESIWRENNEKVHGYLGADCDSFLSTFTFAED